MKPISSSNKPLQAAVIGSGFGGLAAAIRLQASGCRTVLYEALGELGGRAGVFSDQGFTFDRGPTVVTAPECLEELFQLAGKRMADYVELLPVNPMYRLFWEDGSHFDYVATERELLREIERLSPQDVEGYQAFFRYASKVFDKGYTELCHVAFLKLQDMARVAPDLIRLKAYKSVYATVSQFFKDERLRQAFSFSALLIGGNPFNASAIYTLIHPLERKWGVSFPKGGMHALVRALGRLFTDLGGTIHLGTPVEEILTKDGAVVGLAAAGETRLFDLVVSNADVTYTYQRLLKNEKAVASTAKSLARKRYSMSLFVMYFGTRKSYPGLLHHNVMFGPRYRGLLHDIFDRGVVAADFSLYLHAPTLTDPSLAPPGCQSFYVLAPVPHLGGEPYDWEANKKAYGDKILQYLEQRYMPGLTADVVVRHSFTPNDFAGRLHAHLGSAFSLAPILTQSAYFRAHNRDTKIQGLYFVGAGTHPGAGLPGVIGSAKATAHVISGDYGLVERAPTGASGLVYAT